MPLKWVLIHYSDPKHAIRRAKNWLMQQWIGVLEWTWQSPNLNPTENVWADLKETVYNANPKAQQEVWEIVQTTWYSITPKRCQYLINRMPRRCAAVLLNKDYATKY
ncbi:hypothetical protein Trydic_g11390 [Trypoxylus dichotomus]